MVPRRAALESLELGRIKEVKIKEMMPMKGNLYMICPKGDTLSAETREFMDFLGTEKAKLQ